MLIVLGLNSAKPAPINPAWLFNAYNIHAIGGDICMLQRCALLSARAVPGNKFLITHSQSHDLFEHDFFLYALQAPLNKLQDQTCKRVLHAVRQNRLVAEVGSTLQ
jgi:hypothetical protein